LGKFRGTIEIFRTDYLLRRKFAINFLVYQIFLIFVVFLVDESLLLLHHTRNWLLTAAAVNKDSVCRFVLVRH